MSRRFWPCQAGGQGAIARSRMLREGSGTMMASVTSYTWPRPWQVGHAPCGVLGEKSSAYSIGWLAGRSEEHTSELQSLMRISYAVFCLTKKKLINITLFYLRHSLQI